MTSMKSTLKLFTIALTNFNSLYSVFIAWTLKVGVSLLVAPSITKYEQAHEIMTLFVLRKLILQTCMRSHPVWLYFWFLVRPFVYFHTSCIRTAKALARLRRCAYSLEPSLVAYVISTIISCAGSKNVRIYVDWKSHLVTLASYRMDV